MIQFLTRWRLSRCHDDGRTPSPGLRQRASRSEPLARYARSLDAIDHELSGPAPMQEPSPLLILKTLEAVSQIPAGSARATGPARAPLWPLLSSLTVAAVALMLFVARPWHVTHSTPSAHPLTQKTTPRQIGMPEDTYVLGPNESVTREAAALVEESRAFAQSLLRDALPFATGTGK